MPRRGDGLGRRAVVAGEHDDVEALGLQVAERLGRRSLDRVGDAEEGPRLAVDGDEDDRPSLPALGLGSPGEGGEVDAALPRRTRACPRPPSGPRPSRARPRPVCGLEASTGARARPAPRPPARSPPPAGARCRARGWRRGGASHRPRRRARDRDEAGLPSVSVPVLSTTRVSTAPASPAPRRS